MESDQISRYVQEIGYRTLTEIRAHFSTENQEILEAKLSYLLSKNLLRKVAFQSPNGPNTLYYAVPL